MSPRLECDEYQAVREKQITSWPSYLLERASQAPPVGCFVVPVSTPVVAFGYPLNPEVATLGINPSSGEFLDRRKDLLREDKRRLATLESVGAASYADIDTARATQIVDDCADYFERRPYAWFNPLNEVLSGALGVTYFTKSACHLDLVQWATDPIWQGLDEAARQRLLSSDRTFLIKQLRHEGYRLVVVAGRTAMAWIAKAGLVSWKPVARLDQAPAATLFVGQSDGSPRFIGWSCNLQSQPGARRHIPELTRLLHQHSRNGNHESWEKQ